MKVEYLRIRNFKGIGDDGLEINFKDDVTGEIPSRHVLYGDNGSGKTTVLQALALVLSYATGTTRDLENFNWIGWHADSFHLGGSPEIEVCVAFSRDEIDLTKQAWQDWRRGRTELARSRSAHEPSHCPRVKLLLTSGPHGEPDMYYLEPDEEPRALGSNRQMAIREEFRGRRYLASLFKQSRDEERYKQLYKLPGCFWFDQYRTMAIHNMIPQDAGSMEADDLDAFLKSGHLPYEQGWRELNQRLLDMKLNDPSTGQYSDLAKAYERVFPVRSFAEPIPEWPLEKPLFRLFDGKNHYTLPEMSGGEQQIFPQLMAFQQQRVGSSVVLIDELDVHLHPSLAQTLFRTLPDLVPDCQFIITTHSSAIVDVCDPDHVTPLGDVSWL